MSIVSESRFGCSGMKKVAIGSKLIRFEPIATLIL